MRYELLYNEGVKRLEAAGISEAESNVRILFFECFSLSSGSYYFKKNEEIPADAAEEISRFFEWISRREKHEPVQYIVGNQEFYGYRFKVDRRVLIPRLDTEVLVDEVIKRRPSGTMLDLCTGSGCILISLMKRLGLSGVGTDLSEEALEVAQENAVLNAVKPRLLQGDLFEALKDTDMKDRRFDLITANPPYIARKEASELDSEVIDHEPSMALFAEHDGLVMYERILSDINSYLAPGGLLAMEIGCSQGGAVKSLCEKAGLSNIRVVRDLAGLDRVVMAERI